MPARLRCVCLSVFSDIMIHVTVWTGARSLIGSGVAELPVLIELNLLSPQEPPGAPSSPQQPVGRSSERSIRNMHELEVCQRFIDGEFQSLSGYTWLEFRLLDGSCALLSFRCYGAFSAFHLGAGLHPNNRQPLQTLGITLGHVSLNCQLESSSTIRLTIRVKTCFPISACGESSQALLLVQRGGGEKK